MKEIVLKGAEYKALCTKKRVDKKVIFYNENNEVIVYKNKIRFSLPNAGTENEDEFYSFLTNCVGISFSFENMELFLRLINYSLRLNTVNNKLKKIYKERIREYYSCYADFNQSTIEKLAPITYFNKVLYPTIMPVEEAIEKSFLYSEMSHTGYALDQFQKVMKR